MEGGRSAREAQNRQAQLLREWHSGPDVLLLPCAWDVTSAKVFEAEGFKALGTTSAGIAATLGHSDGQKIDFDEYLHVVRRIVRAVRLPVTVDFEAGFGTSVEQVAQNTEDLLRSGAVGLNIEDENHARSEGHLLDPIPLVVAKIRAIRAVGDAFGVAVFINAKSDAVWLSAGASLEASVDEAVRRANAYGESGADCVFIPGNFDAPRIARLVAAIRYPLNIVLKESTPPVSVLRSLGVKRLSLGSGPMRAAVGLTKRIARELGASGTYDLCLDLALPFEEVQAMVRR
jgi:2-methylisocitrate lyase-like PEP mutase family enzyme